MKSAQRNRPNNNSNKDRYVTTLELAKLVGLHPTTLARWRTLRQGPPYTKLGHKVLYRLDAFYSWLDNQERIGVRS